MEPDAAREGAEEQIQHYRELQDVANSEHFEKFFGLLIQTVADKMIWAFTTGKDGDNIKNWDEFCRLRGEIVARLEPIQTVKGAQSVADYLSKQLEEYYAKQL